MAPILGRYGPFFLYSFTVVISLGFVVGLGLIVWHNRRQRHADWIDACLASLIGAVAGGRLLFVLANWGYFQIHVREGWQFWRGGLAYYGCLLGALLGLFIWCVWRDRSFSEYGDLFAPAIALLSVFGWLACWFEACGYGRETVIGPLAAALPDVFGVVAVRYQTQLYGVLSTLAIFAIVWALRNRTYPGQLFWLTVFLLSLNHALIGFFRGDLASWRGLIPSVTFVDVAIALIAAGGFVMVSHRAAHSRTDRNGNHLQQQG